MKQIKVVHLPSVIQSECYEVTRILFVRILEILQNAYKSILVAS